MLGINYESSDEEASPVAKPQKTIATNAPAVAPAPKEPEALRVEQPAAPTGPLNGPAQGPAASPPQAAVEDAPVSPYTSTRSAIQNLTLPSVPNFDIPPSPPGSPPPQSTKKFAQFLELKKKGQHFNQRLETSSVIRDPAHLQRLMDFAGISEEEQYASTLPDDVAIPTTFPQWAYVEKLRESQKKIAKAKENANAKNPRVAIDFVAASKSGASSGTASGRGSHQSAAERVMAGLDKQVSSKRKDLEQRSGRDDSSSRSRWRSGSRSPKRRRSKSRDRK